MTFTVLHVCLGNICRSPMAERILRHELERRFGPASSEVVSHSAGTYAGIAGDPMNHPAAAALTRLGVDAAGFTARGLERWMVVEADLVLTATRDQARRLVAFDPDAGSRTFTLRELAVLTASLGSFATGTLDQRLAALVRSADAARQADPERVVDDLDVADPYGEPDHVFDATAEQIAAAIKVILDSLAQPA